MSNASEPKRCPQCGGPIPPEAPQGLCPKCLLVQASVPTEAEPGAAVRPAPPARETLAAAFPQLEILELIGQGGMGFVFKARQPKLDRIVALKILPQSLAADPAFAERFTREGRVLARLNHPNIVTIHDFGVAGAPPSTADAPPFYYLLMEFVDGVNLRQAMKVGRFTPAQALAIVPKICEALQFAHNEGVLHRDIKPENILLDAKGRVKIADFGIAKLIEGDPKSSFRVPPSGGPDRLKPELQTLTEAGKVLGTPNYMAPEQIETPQEVDHRADVYSLGVVFYEMLTGELPLGRFAPPSERSSADPRVDQVVLHALEKERERRTQTAGEVKTQVETIAGAPANPAAASANAPPPSVPTVQFGSKTALLALGLFLAGTLGTPVLLAVSSEHHESPAIIFGFAALMLSAVCSFTQRRHRLGKFVLAGNAGVVLILMTIALIAMRTAELRRREAQAGLQRLKEQAEAFRLQNMPRASAETWSPSFPPGEKPDLQKILDEAKDLMSRGRFEESLQRHLWHFNHAMEFGDSYQNIVRLTSGIPEWEELARRYPKAKQALIEIRDDRTQKILEGQGYTEIVDEVQTINHELQNDGATYALLKTIQQKDPKLAKRSYYYVEDLLMAQGDYALCLAILGDPQAHFESCCHGLESQRQSQLRMDEMKKRLKMPQPIGGYTPPDMGQMATNNFVRQVGKLIEILVGAGRKNDAEAIRNQAVTAVDDPRLKTAVSDAEERVRKNKSFPQAASAPAALVWNSRPANLPPVAPASPGNPAAGPLASAELWAPPDYEVQLALNTNASSEGVVDPATGLAIRATRSGGINPANGLRPGSDAILRQVLDEADEMTARHQYEESLQRHLWHFNHAPEFGDSYQNTVRLTSALSAWEELARRYPKARQALIEIRDRETQAIVEGRGYANIFQDVQAINHELQNDDATVALFKIVQQQDPKLASQSYSAVEDLLMAKGDYALCLTFIGDPQARFKSLRRSWESSKQISGGIRALPVRATRFLEPNASHAEPPAASNAISSATNRSLTTPIARGASGIPSPAQASEDYFVRQVSKLVRILAGAGQTAMAEKIQQQAVALLDDARLKSALKDAETIGK